jgi:hypothetical protein
LQRKRYLLDSTIFISGNKKNVIAFSQHHPAFTSTDCKLLLSRVASDQ